MLRFFVITVEDLLSDPVAAGRTLEQAVRRNRPMRFQSLCPLGDDLLIVLSGTEHDTAAEMPPCFTFSRLRSLSSEQTAADVTARWRAGYELLAAFPAGDSLWALYSSQKTD